MPNKFGHVCFGYGHFHFPFHLPFRYIFVINRNFEKKSCQIGRNNELHFLEFMNFNYFATIFHWKKKETFLLWFLDIGNYTLHLQIEIVTVLVLHFLRLFQIERAHEEKGNCTLSKIDNFSVRLCGHFTFWLNFNYGNFAFVWRKNERRRLLLC